VAICQTKIITIITPPATIATMGQLIPAPVFDVEGNPGFCAPVLGGAKLAADN
jgi:hypothetical protein